jgi:thiamine-monophosphate kinase
MAERAFLAHLAAQFGQTSQHIPLAVGDDGCVVDVADRLTLSVDTVVEGRHFTAGTEPHAIGHKAMAAALSDLAAMGAIPVGALVALSGPSSVWAAIQAGMADCAESYACLVIGGDTTTADAVTVSVTVLGRPAVAGGRLLTRDAAQSGDLLVVTGRLGGAYDASTGNGRHLRPEPRLTAGQWLAQRDFVHAAMDLSDGLLVDAQRLAAASGRGLVLFGSQLPLHADIPTWTDGVRAAMTDGEDYELLFSVDPAQWPTLMLAWPFADELPLTQVGMLRSEADLVLVEDSMGRLGPPPAAWQVFEHR